MTAPSRRTAARWLLAAAPSSFGPLGCSNTSYEPLPLATDFGLVRVESSPTNYDASASFRTNVEANCTLGVVGDGRVVTRCSSNEPTGTVANAGTVTIQGNQTVTLDADNQYAAAGDQTLYASGQEVLLDATASAEVPGFSATMNAPASTSLSAPLPASSGAPLPLVRGQSLTLEWTPGNYGFMKFHANSGLVGVTCEWTISDGVSVISAHSIDQLASSDGSDSTVAFWTEQNTVVRDGSWEFLLLLAGQASGSEFAGFTLE